MESIYMLKQFIAVLISVLCYGLWIIALAKFVKDFSEFSLNENLLISLILIISLIAIIFIGQILRNSLYYETSLV
jgi:hypothetical protein